MKKLLKVFFDVAEIKACFRPETLRRTIHLRYVHDLWFKPVDARRLDFFLRWFTFAMLIYFATWFLEWREWLTDYGFHYTKETKHWYHPDPWPTLSPSMVPFYGFLLFGSGVAILLGWKTRLMVWVFFLGALYAQLVDADSAFTLNKYAIVFLFAIGLSPRPKRVASEDGEERWEQSAWPIRVVQATLIIQYFTAGTCKLMHGDWLEHTDVLWTQVQGVYRTDSAAFLLRTLPKWAWSPLMYGSLLFELCAALLFIVRPLRPLGILLGIGFHMGIALTMHKLFFFSFQLMTLYLLFLDERVVVSMHSWFGNLVRRWGGSSPPAS